MNHDARTMLQGEVVDIFAHRFVVKTGSSKVLADLTPKGAEQIALHKGDRVTLSGEMKPSELKVHQIKRDGDPSITIQHKKQHPDQHEPADPENALKTVTANGLTVVGNPRRKPKHFEILGRDSAGDFVELHVELGGALRKTRPVDEANPKWASEIRNRF